MFDLRGYLVIAAVLFTSTGLHAQDNVPSFDYDVARAHEIKPHRRTIPVDGIRQGSTQLRLTLTVSPLGDVMKAEANGEDDALKYWQSVQGEVYRWHFTPFEKGGKAVTAGIEEYIDLVPPERRPKVHIAAPAIRPDSQIFISLQRSGCFGSCPSYKVTLSSDGTISFEGDGYVVAQGNHTGHVDPDRVRDLAKSFVASDFYSMDDEYHASVTDNPTYLLSISIDGKEKKVLDYVGSWEGMPELITELEDKVDDLAQTDRWITGTPGLVSALQTEKYQFHTFDAQVMLKAAAQRGQTTTVIELLAAGVPLEPIPAPTPKEPYTGVPFNHVGWLSAASDHPDTLRVLINASASKDDQKDKDLALAGAASAGNLDAVRALIAYGGDPNVDISKLTVTQEGGGTMQGPGSGSVLIYAAESGSPDVVREILRYKPKLEARGHDGQTAIFAAGDYRRIDQDGARVECVRLLAEAGGNINAKDDDGSTPLHEIFLDDVVEELIKLGADVNARDNDGDTPIFTNVSDEAVRIMIRHGASTTIRNNKGETVFDDAHRHGPQREQVLREAVAEVDQSKQ